MMGGTGVTPAEGNLLLGVLVLVLATWLPPQFRRTVAVGAAAVTFVTAAGLAVTGLRWQMIPVLVAFVLILPLLAGILMRKLGEERGRLWLPGLVSVIGVLAIMASVSAAVAFPIPVFPTPTGKYAVGTTIVEWSDPERPEAWTAEPADGREVQAQIWYPARASLPDVERARYLGRSEVEANAVAEGIGAFLGIPRFTFDGAVAARTDAVPEAPVAAGDERFPVVVFSPGGGMGRATNTAWAEELASHGYVVAALDHPYDSTVVMFTDGRTIHRLDYPYTNEADARRLSEELAAVKAADLSSALTYLERINSGEVENLLSGHLDTGRAAVAGMSAGVGGAFQAARTDERFAVLLALDGRPYDGEPGPYGQPALAMTNQMGLSDNPTYLPELGQGLERSTATGYLLTIPGTAHSTFTDAPLWWPPIPWLVGSLGRTEGNRIITEVTIGFLDAELRGQPVDLPGFFSGYGELAVYDTGE